MRVDLMHRVDGFCCAGAFCPFVRSAVAGRARQAPQRGGAAELLAADPVLEERVTERCRTSFAAWCIRTSPSPNQNAPLAVDLQPGA